jgi:hypothetical protein
VRVGVGGARCTARGRRSGRSFSYLMNLIRDDQEEVDPRGKALLDGPHARLSDCRG